MLIDDLAADVRRLSADLLLVRDDLIERLNGKQIVFAPDFSEIYAYLMPHEALSEFRIFRDDNSHECMLAQSRALSHLLFSDEHKRLLLPPYSLELQNWLYRRSNADRDSLARQVRDALGSVRRMIKTPRFSRALALCNQTSELDAGQERFLIEYFEEEAGEILALYSMEAVTPKRKLDTISSQQLMPQDIWPSENAVDHKTYTDWIEIENSLAHRRNEPKLRDAAAVARVTKLNQDDYDHRVVRIVSRSSSMEQTARNLAKTWADCGGNPIRHTRSFAFLENIQSSNQERHLRLVEDSLKELEAFLDLYDEIGDSQDLDSASISPLVASIKGLWHRGGQLATSLEARQAVLPLKRTKNSRLSGVRSIIEAMKSRDTLRSLITNRVFELVNEIEFDYRSMGLALHEGHRNLSEVVTVNNDSTQELSFSSWAISYPYKVYFSSDLAGSVGSNLKTLGEFDAAAMSARLREASESFRDPSSHLERMLLLAFCFAAFGRYKIAGSYCEAALQATDRSQKINLYEAVFMKVSCASRALRTKETIGDMLDTVLDLAGGTKEQLLTKTNDLRLLTEAARGIFFLCLRGQNNIMEQRGFTSNDALWMSDKVIRKAEADEQLYVATVNNVCYFCSSTPELQGQAKKYLQLLEKVRKPLKQSYHPWPEIEDTIVWSIYCTASEPLSRPDLERLKERLDRILETGARNSSERREVEEHRDAIAKDLVNLN